MRYVDPDHFSTGVWAADGPLRLRTLTCLGCGHRAPTFAAFRAHRPGCSGRLGAVPTATAAEGGRERERPDRVDGGFALTVDDLDHLAALAAQVDPAG